MLCVVVYVKGMTQMDDVIYAVCPSSSKILTFAADTLRPLGVNIKVSGMIRPIDIVVCVDDRQLFVADWDCIWRVSADDQSHVKWLSTESATHSFRVWSLSLTSRRLLMSLDPRTLRQYRTTDDAQLLRVVELPRFVRRLCHGVEMARGTFVVGHRGTPNDGKQFAVSELIGCRNVNVLLQSSVLCQRMWYFTIQKISVCVKPLSGVG